MELVKQSSTNIVLNTEEVVLEDEDVEQVDRKSCLVYTKHKRIEVKDFCIEVRALRDLERFLSKPTVLLNVNERGLDGILDIVLEQLIPKLGSSRISLKNAKNAFLSKDCIHCLSHVIQGTEKSEGSGWEETQGWLVAMAEISSVHQSNVAIARLRHTTNLGRTLQGTHLVVLVCSPKKTKKTKSSLETGRTFATLLSDMDVRQQLLSAESEEEFLRVICKYKEVIEEQQYKEDNERTRSRSVVKVTSSFDQQGDLSTKGVQTYNLLAFGRGLKEDIKRRLFHYTSDFADGVTGHRTLQKLAATVLFLYFACLLPSIAFGVLNSKNTKGKLGIRKVIISQSCGGIVFSLFAGQPLIVLLTTAPLALYVKVIHSICEDFNLDFFAMYSMTGLWNAFFLIIYSLFGVSNLMRWSTRSTNEIFGLFISVAFTVAALSSIHKEYKKQNCVGVPYSSCNLCQQINMSTGSATCTSFKSEQCFCSHEGGILYILLSFGTVLLAITLYNCKKSPFLDANKREALADYALPVSVILFSFVGSFVFKDIKANKLDFNSSNTITVSSISSLPAGAMLGACGLGFCLSFLFFMAQNIVSTIVNNPSNRLKKGTAYHLDLLVIGILNGCLSLFGLPWVYAALPHSPLHVRALADIEERVDQGHVYELIVKVRENRLSLLLSHILVGLSLFMVPTPLDYIPSSVLDGLFLFVAITPLFNSQMFERFLLLVTEQSAYPPNHYIRRVPQRKIHLYTGIQFLQLLVLCAFGFAGSLSYIRMLFPVLLILLLPIRHGLVPKFIHYKYLDAMDANL